ncbi:MAG: hypothetical protein ACOYBE_09425 [Blautia sp.]|jgi:hypothetical protein
MRKTFYSIGVFLFLCVLSLGFYGSYKVSDMKTKIQNLESSLEKEKSKETESISRLITDATKCTIEEYDRNTGELKEQTTFAADNIVGMSREDLTAFLQNSNTAYYRYALVAYSPEHVVIRQSRTVYGTYYLKEEDGNVVVYKGDKKTVFEPTQIALNSLPEKLQKEIREGKFIDSEEELYNFLENYSS